MHSDQCKVTILMRNASEWLIKKIKTENNKKYLISLKLINLV